MPFSLAFNGLAHAVMMVTPTELEDFVYGFVITQEIVEQALVATFLDEVAQGAGGERRKIDRHQLRGLRQRTCERPSLVGFSTYG